MKKFYSNELSTFTHKKVSFAFAIIISVLWAIYKFTGIGFEDESEVRMLEYLLIGNLLVMIFSKEKYDDERTKEIRYFCLKNSFGLLIFALGFNNMMKHAANYIYIVLFVELFYFALFYWGNTTNPKVIFQEKTRAFKSSDAVGMSILGLVVFIYIAAAIKSLF